VNNIFTAADFARACGLREERAHEFLEHFATVGIVEPRLRSGWVATRRGLALSRGLALTAPERRAA
jgi:hypothetical protein